MLSIVGVVFYNQVIISCHSVFYNYEATGFEHVGVICTPYITALDRILAAHSVHSAHVVQIVMLCLFVGFLTMLILFLRATIPPHQTLASLFQK